VCKVLVVDVALHCDLQGVHWRIAGRTHAAALSSVFRQCIMSHRTATVHIPYDVTFRGAH
jgi:hypothetical protein